MKIVEISEETLDEIFFVEFPDPMPRQECRDTLELLIADDWEEDCQGLNEDECPELVISPFTVDRAIARKRMQDFHRMSSADKDRIRKEFWEQRKQSTRTTK